MVFFFFIVFSIILALILFELKKKIGNRLFFYHPITISILFFFIIHLLLPLIQWNSNFFRYQKNYDEDVYVYSLFITFFNFILFIVGFNLFFWNKKINSTFSIENFNLKNIKSSIYFSFIIMVVGVYFVYKSVYYIFSLGIDSYIQDRLTLETGNGFVLLMSHWLYISVIIFFFILQLNTYKKYNILLITLFIISFVLTIIYYTINSNRNSLFLLVLILLIVYFVFNKKKVDLSKLNFFDKMKFFIVIVIATLFFQYQGNERKANQMDNSKVESGFIEGMNGAFGNHENIVWLILHKFDLQFGATYLSGFTNFIPRSIWPDKPLGSGPVLKNMISPGSYVVGRKGNSSVTTGLFTESLMNFGLIGMTPFSLLYGLFIKFFYLKLMKSKNILQFLMLLYLMLLLNSQFYYAEFAGFLSRTIFTIIPFFLLNKIIYK
jgi:oligosaccharide repeat unit polymerase